MSLFEADERIRAARIQPSAIAAVVPPRLIGPWAAALSLLIIALTQFMRKRYRKNTSFV